MVLFWLSFGVFFLGVLFLGDVTDEDVLDSFLVFGIWFDALPFPSWMGRGRVALVPSLFSFWLG